MSDDYKFQFFKPNKKFYTKKELEMIIANLKSFGFDAVPAYPASSYVQNGNFKFKKQETQVNIDIYYNSEGVEYYFMLMLSLDENDNSFIGSLFAEHEQFDYKEPEFEGQWTEMPSAEVSKRLQVLYKAAVAITYALEPYFVWGDTELIFGYWSGHVSFDKVTALAWMNLFSFDFVEKLGGLDKVLLYPHPEVERMYAESKKTGKYMFIPLQLAENPLEEIPKNIRKKCQEKFPGVVLR